MKSLRQIIIGLPEYYLIALVIILGFIHPFPINLSPTIVGLIIIIFLQIVFKNKISGYIIASLFILVNLYMLGVLVSEIVESSTFDTSAKQLLFGGTLFFGFNLFISVLMIFKYAISDKIRKLNSSFPREY